MEKEKEKKKAGSAHVTERAQTERLVGWFCSIAGRDGGGIGEGEGKREGERNTRFGACCMKTQTDSLVGWFCNVALETFMLHRGAGRGTRNDFD